MTVTVAMRRGLGMAAGLMLAASASAQSDAAPEAAVAAYEASFAEAEAGNHAQAVERLLHALELAPGFYAAWLRLGMLFLEQRQFVDAQAAFLEAGELRPESPEPLLNLGLMYYVQGEVQEILELREDAAFSYREAVTILEEAVQRDEESAVGQFYLGNAYYKAGGYEAAEAALQHALNLDAGLHEARIGLINIYARTSRLDEALFQIDAYLALNPDASQKDALLALREQLEAVRVKR